MRVTHDRNMTLIPDLTLIVTEVAVIAHTMLIKMATNTKSNASL